jgi:hypothetical protein
MAGSVPFRSLVQEYAEVASAHGQATAAGDGKRANQAHELVAGIYRRLCEHGEQRGLLPLLDHDDPAVVGWAGAHALEFAPHEGERALREYSQRDDGVIGFGAQMTLGVHDGKLSFHSDCRCEAQGVARQGGCPWRVLSVGRSSYGSMKFTP